MNAIAVYLVDKQLGYIERSVARYLAPVMDCFQPHQSDWVILEVFEILSYFIVMNNRRCITGKQMSSKPGGTDEWSYRHSAHCMWTKE